jgi:mRNA interferase MazF
VVIAGPCLSSRPNSFNVSRIATVIAAVITSNVRLADAPSIVRLPVRGTGLSKPSVVNVSQIITLEKTFLTERIGRISTGLLASVDDGLRLALSL